MSFFLRKEILRGLQEGFPDPKTEVHKGVHALLGEINLGIIERACEVYMCMYVLRCMHVSCMYVCMNMLFNWSVTLFEYVEFDCKSDQVYV